MKKIRLPKFKKETLYLFAAGIACVLLLVGTVLLLNSHLKSSAATDVSKIDSSRSQVMVTGEGYHAQRGKKSEQEKKRESRTRSDKSKAWKKAAPNSKNRKRSENRTGKVIKSDAGEKNGREGKEPSEIPPREEAGTPDNADKPPADDANSGTNKRKKGKNKGKNSRDKDNTATKDPNAPVLSVNFSNVDEKKTEEKKNGTIYINGTKLRFSLSATTYEGRKIERSEKWYVWLNGGEDDDENRMYSSGDRYIGLYSAKIDQGGGSKLKAGRNRIIVSVTDTEDNKTTETYKISMDPSQEGEKKGVATVSVDLKQLGIEKSPIDTLKVTINDDETVGEVVERYLKMKNVGFDLDKTGRFLDRIHKKNITKGIPKKIREKYFPYPDYEPFEKDSLGSRDFGKDSGWKYKIGTKYPSVGMWAMQANDGDKIFIEYTLEF